MYLVSLLQLVSFQIDNFREDQSTVYNSAGSTIYRYSERDISQLVIRGDFSLSLSRCLKDGRQEKKFQLKLSPPTTSRVSRQQRFRSCYNIRIEMPPIQRMFLFISCGFTFLHLPGFFVLLKPQGTTADMTEQDSQYAARARRYADQEYNIQREF